MSQPVLSVYQVEPLVKAWRASETTATTSLDLGMTTVEAQLSEADVTFAGGLRLPWAALDAALENPVAVFTVEGEALEKVQRFSDLFNRAYSLMPTPRAPTLLISGIPMHRIKEVDPVEDTRRKVRAAQPRGVVLDTATGLGYTAIAAARTAERVITIELDPTTLDVARLNPWSAELFDHPKIEQRVGDSFEEVETFDDETFSVIIHDPPIMSLAGELYSTEMYRSLWRILKRRGRLFHYIGDPEGKMGANTTRGATRRLQEAGFSRIERRPEAFGVVAYK